MTGRGPRKAQVLLVEDNLTDATLIRAVLEKDEEIQVTLAQDGIRGCELAEIQRWDLVITDVNLPGRDGIEVIQAAHAYQPDTPVVATSAYLDPAYREGAKRSGAHEVLSKPLDPEELLSTVRALLAHKGRTDALPQRILAVGALPGDVEAGCGGSLLKHASAGHQIEIVVLSSGPPGTEGEDRRAAAVLAARALGAGLHLPPEELTGVPPLDRAVMRIQDAIRDLDPQIIYAPSAHDVRESRRTAHRAAEIAAAGVASFFRYQAASTTLDFRPTLFEDISDFLDQKMAALTHYQAQVWGRPHLDPALARASALYWGRFLGYGKVEPFEVTRHEL